MEWISVKDRLPEYGQKVIVCNVNERSLGCLIIAREKGNPDMCDKNDFRTNYWITEVTHWGVPSEEDWIDVEDAIPQSERTVCVLTNRNEVTFNHRTFDKGIRTDKHQFCVYWGQDEEVLKWFKVEIPKVTREKQKNFYTKIGRVKKEQLESEEFLSKEIAKRDNELKRS